MTDKLKDMRVDLVPATKARAIAEKILINAVLGTVAGRLALDEIIGQIETASNSGAVRVIIDSKLLTNGMKPFLEAKGYYITHLGKKVQIAF